MTGERRETTILPNVSDEDLSIVSSDTRTRSQSQVDCMEPNITLQAGHKIFNYMHLSTLKEVSRQLQARTASDLKETLPQSAPRKAP